MPIKGHEMGTGTSLDKPPGHGERYVSFFSLCAR